MPSFSCEQCEEALPGYVLNALAVEDAAVVAAHVHSCPQCQASLAAYEAVLDRLADLVPQHEPPAELHERVRAAMSHELRPAPAVDRASRPSSLRPWWQVRWTTVVTAASILLCLGAFWWAWQTRLELQATRERLRYVMQQLDFQRGAMALLAQPESRRVLLRSEGKPARGMLLLEGTAPQAVLFVQDLPRLQPDRVYQLWLLRDSVRDNGGIFRVDEQGSGMLAVQAPYPFSAYRAAGITEEPAGGSPGPTTPRVIGGSL